MAQSSSSQGRLEQQLSERGAAIKERDDKIAVLERQLNDSMSQADSLTSRLNEQELVIVGKDQRISELNALIGDRSRYILIVLVYQFLRGLAPQYLGPLNYVADLPGRRPLHSAGTNRLAVPPVKLTTVVNWAFRVVGPRTAPQYEC